MAKPKEAGTRESVHKRTCQGGKKPKLSKLNKGRRNSYKKYCGQGR